MLSALHGEYLGRLGGSKLLHRLSSQLAARSPASRSGSLSLGFGCGYSTLPLLRTLKGLLKLEAGLLQLGGHLQDAFRDIIQILLDALQLFGRPTSVDQPYPRQDHLCSQTPRSLQRA